MGRRPLLYNSVLLLRLHTQVLAGYISCTIGCNGRPYRFIKLALRNGRTVRFGPDFGDSQQENKVVRRYRRCSWRDNGRRFQGQCAQYPFDAVQN